MDFEINCDGNHKGDIPNYHSLGRDGIIDMLRLAKRHKNDARTVSKVQVRLGQAIPGMTCPYPIEGPVSERHAALDELFVARFHEGPADDLVDLIERLTA